MRLRKRLLVWHFNFSQSVTHGLKLKLHWMLATSSKMNADAYMCLFFKAFMHSVMLMGIFCVSPRLRGRWRRVTIWGTGNENVSHTEQTILQKVCHILICTRKLICSAYVQSCVGWVRPSDRWVIPVSHPRCCETVLIVHRTSGGPRIDQAKRRLSMRIAWAV